MKTSTIVGVAVASLVAVGILLVAVRSAPIKDRPHQQTSTAADRSSASATVEGPPVPADPRLVALAQRTRTFGRALSAALVAHEDSLERPNSAISPPSIYATLNLLAHGTSGKTRAEIVDALGTTDVARTDDGVDALMLALRSATNPRELVLESNTAIWIGNAWEALPEFRADAVRLERAETHHVAFSTPQATLDMNSWASKKTHGLIEELFPAGELDPDTVLVLTNTIYFRAVWKSPFPKQDTSERPFSLANGKVRTVPTMKQQAVFGISRTAHAEVIELPYLAAGFSMFITLPQADRFPTVEQDTNSHDFVRKAASSMAPEEVVLELPRFRVATTTELAPALQNLGIHRVFTPGAALDRLLRGNHENLHLATVRHGLVVDVAEEQTEAAAATSAGVRVVSPIPALRVDRPFLFAIVHRPTWTVLFSGRVMDPSG